MCSQLIRLFEKVKLSLRCVIMRASIQFEELVEMHGAILFTVFGIVRENRERNPALTSF